MDIRIAALCLRRSRKFAGKRKCATEEVSVVFEVVYKSTKNSVKSCRVTYEWE